MNNRFNFSAAQSYMQENWIPNFSFETQVIHHCVNAQWISYLLMRRTSILKFISFGQKVVTEDTDKILASLTCRARPLVSIGRVNAEMAHMTQTDEKRHRAPRIEAFIRTCKSQGMKEFSVPHSLPN